MTTAMTTLIRRRPLSAFFVLAYLGSWVAWSPWWLSESGVGLLPFDPPASAVAGINQLGLFAGPFAAALLLTRIADGSEGVRRLLRRLVQWRTHPTGYVLALVAIPLATGIGYLAVPGSPGSGPGRGLDTLGPLAATYLIYLLGGPIQEEPGWRGFALPRLQERLPPISAALVLGVIHCGWHAPLFLTAEWDTARDGPDQYAAYLLLVVAMSVVMSWLINGGGGSVVPAILGHNGVNWALYAAGVLTGVPVESTWPAALGMTGLAIVAVVVTRGRLRLGTSEPDRG